MKSSTDGYKKCRICKTLKPLDLFYKDMAKPDKKDSACKPCQNAYNKTYRKKSKAKISKKQKEYRDTHREAGICTRCPNKATKGQYLCELCWYKMISGTHLGTVTIWMELKKIAIDQNFKCIYTGEKLIPGQNMSLDHIIPRSKSHELSDEPKNMQWVVTKINTIKNDQTHDEFISLCKLISKRFGD